MDYVCEGINKLNSKFWENRIKNDEYKSYIVACVFVAAVTFL
jgi:hypothetical protein